MALSDPTAPKTSDVRSTGLRSRIQLFFRGLRRQPFSGAIGIGPVIPSSSPSKSTQGGATSADTLEATMFQAFFRGPSAARTQVYTDMEEMVNTVDEAEAGLFILATNATTAPRSGDPAFRIEWAEENIPDVVKEIAETVIERCRFSEKAYSIARDTLMYGDAFMQLVVTDDLLVSRVMYMPPSTMVRNELPNGLLKDGNETGEWAFEQYIDDKLIAGFYPWQICHLR